MVCKPQIFVEWYAKTPKFVKTRGGYANANAGSKTRVLRLRAFSVRHFRNLRSAFLNFPWFSAKYGCFFTKKWLDWAWKRAFALCVRPFYPWNARLRSTFSSWACVPTSDFLASQSLIFVLHHRNDSTRSRCCNPSGDRLNITWIRSANNIIRRIDRKYRRWNSSKNIRLIRSPDPIFFDWSEEK